MSKFEDNVHQDTPRLVITYQVVDNQERLGWGVVGIIPALSLIGGIIRVQTELFLKGHTVAPCPDSALCMTFDPMTKRVDWYMHPAIPREVIAGMLEQVKLIVIGSHAQNQMAKMPILLDPMGQPMRRGIS